MSPFVPVVIVQTDDSLLAAGVGFFFYISKTRTHHHRLVGSNSVRNRGETELKPVETARFH